jgi:hypothetical protein
LPGPSQGLPDISVSVNAGDQVENVAANPTGVVVPETEPILLAELYDEAATRLAGERADAEFTAAGLAVTARQ